MTASYDFVFVGSGHNALTAAAYLAAGGQKVLILERNDWFGGGVITREMTAPGFRHDLHSTEHLFIQANPMIERDELGLKSRFGLEYICPESTYASVFTDTTAIQQFFDVDKSCESIAVHSTKDAETYRIFAKKCGKLLPLFVSGMFAPPVPFGAFMNLLDQSEEGRDLIDVLHKSSYDVITEMFENEKVRLHFLKYASEGMVGPEEKGTGIILLLIVGFAHSYRAGLPKGGSAGLTNALIRCIEHHGGELRKNSEVQRAIVGGGRAQGVVLQSGESIEARRAVVGSIHPHLLDNFLGGALDRSTKWTAKTVQQSSFSAMNTHYALNEAPSYKAGKKIDESFVIECLPSNLEEFRRDFDRFRYGELPKNGGLVVASTTNFDPTRAPAGKATLYMYNFMPYALKDGGPEKWDEIKEQVADWMLDWYRLFTTNMGPENIIGRYVDSPLDIERSSPSFQRGDIFGAASFLSQFLGRRPTPALANYRVPGLDSFYLVGPFMHPGGGVIGGGRATAMKIIEDYRLNTRVFVA